MKSANTFSKMKTPTKALEASVAVESLDAFFGRMRGNARRLDRGERVKAGINISFEDPADFLEVVTPARARLLKSIGNEPLKIGELVALLHRDPAAVRRDVKLLERSGLVTMTKVSNPGHGYNTLIARAAKHIKLEATV
jgi:predicted transcriptional regulator